MTDAAVTATTANPLVCPACGATRVLALAPGDAAGPDAFDCPACGATNGIEPWQCCVHCAYGRHRCGRAETRLSARPTPRRPRPDPATLAAQGRELRSGRRPPGWGGLLRVLGR